jgi:hypothetical protein
VEISKLKVMIVIASNPPAGDDAPRPDVERCDQGTSDVDGYDREDADDVDEDDEVDAT